MKGYILISRKIMDLHFYFSEPFTKTQAWIDLLLLANYQDSRFQLRGITIRVKRGQIARSEDFFAKRWRWSRGKVRRFLNELANEQRIVQQTVQQNCRLLGLITIINYDAYQTDGTTNGTTDSTTNGTTNGTGNNKSKIKVKTKKKELLRSSKEKFSGQLVVPSADDVKSLVLEELLFFMDPDEIGKFMEYWAGRQWRDKHGPIKDWKARLRSWHQNKVPKWTGIEDRKLSNMIRNDIQFSNYLEVFHHAAYRSILDNGSIEFLDLKENTKDDKQFLATYRRDGKKRKWFEETYFANEDTKNKE